MDPKLMRALAAPQEFSEHCGCEDDDMTEGRAEAEKAIWNFFPSDSKAKLKGHRSVMFTGAVAKAAKLPEYTTIKLSDLTDHQIQSVLAAIQKKGEAALDSMPIENLLQHEETSDRVRESVYALAERYEGNLKKAYVVTMARLQRDEAPAEEPVSFEQRLEKALATNSHINPHLHRYEAKQTYAAAQQDIMAGLEKDGWQLNKGLKIPWAKSPNGKHKLWFKAQAIYLSRGDQQFGQARSVHAGDIRDGGYDKFAGYLSRWTGEKPAPKKDAPSEPAKAPASAPAAAAPAKPDAPAVQLTPDQYHAKHGKCPEGYHHDGKRCVKAGTEAKQHLCPECNEQMTYVEEKDDWACDGCGIPNKKTKDEKPGKPKMPVAAKAPTDESFREFARLSGVQRYPDRKVVAEKTLTALDREYAGITDAHDDWRLKPLWPIKKS